MWPRNNAVKVPHLKTMERLATTVPQWTLQLAMNNGFARTASAL